jgi:CHAD domain-containing protein
MQSLITTLLILAVLVLIWHVRELWGEVDLLKTMERKTQESQANFRKEFNDYLFAYRQERKVFLERIHDAEDTIDGFRTAFDMFGQNYEEDRKALGECVGKLQESLDEIKDSAIERNKEEARMFEGISNMMNYDISTAREAVKDIG